MQMRQRPSLHVSAHGRPQLESVASPAPNYFVTIAPISATGGRSIRIHLVVRPASSAGESTTTSAIAISQLFFPEDLTQEIFETVGGYVEHGQPDTSFDSDNVLTSVADITPYVVDYPRMSDGAMLAWKNIVISSTDSCGSIGEGGGGPGGAPPGPPPG